MATSKAAASMSCELGIPQSDKVSKHTPLDPEDVISTGNTSGPIQYPNNTDGQSQTTHIFLLSDEEDEEDEARILSLQMEDEQNRLRRVADSITTRSGSGTRDVSDEEVQQALSDLISTSQT